MSARKRPRVGETAGEALVGALGTSFGATSPTGGSVLPGVAEHLTLLALAPVLGADGAAAALLGG